MENMIEEENSLDILFKEMEKNNKILHLTKTETDATNIIMRYAVKLITEKSYIKVLVKSNNMATKHRQLELFNELYKENNIIKSNKNEIKFANGSTIYFVNKINSNIRGITINYTLWDGVAYDDDLEHSLFYLIPVCAVNNKIIMISKNNLEGNQIDMITRNNFVKLV